MLVCMPLSPTADILECLCDAQCKLDESSMSSHDAPFLVPLLLLCASQSALLFSHGENSIHAARGMLKTWEHNNEDPISGRIHVQWALDERTPFVHCLVSHLHEYPRLWIVCCMVLWDLVPWRPSHLHKHPIYIPSQLSGPHCIGISCDWDGFDGTKIHTTTQKYNSISGIVLSV